MSQVQGRQAPLNSGSSGSQVSRARGLTPGQAAIAKALNTNSKSKRNSNATRGVLALPEVKAPKLNKLTSKLHALN